MTTHYRLFTLSPSDSQLHIIPAELLTDAVAQARATHHERTGDNPDLIYVKVRDALHPRWTPVASDMEYDYKRVRTS